MELRYQQENLELNMETTTRIGLWCLPGSITYHESPVMYLRDQGLKLVVNFGKIFAFPGCIDQIPGKGRGVIATRDIRKNELVAIYPGTLVTQA